MERRTFLKALSALGACPLCPTAGFTAEALHWGYEGEAAADHWASLSPDNKVCAVGTQQSPIDITTATKADLPPVAVDWKNAGGTIVNNGHTIQVNLPAGSTLMAGGETYELIQYHFHTPSEHRVGHKSYAMEVHFVHKNKTSGGFGVLGVFMEAGKVHPAFAKLAAAMPRQIAGESSGDGIDPKSFLPDSLAHWIYEGSLTTPPCNEVVDWMVCVNPIQVAQADIDRFKSLYPMNARPVQSANRRFVLLGE